MRIPEVLGPQWLDDCEIGGPEHEDILVARLIRLINVHVRFNHHTEEKWMRINLPTCLDDSDEFITRVKTRVLGALNEHWQTAMHVDKRSNPGTLLFLMVPGSPAAIKFADTIAQTNNREVGAVCKVS